MAGAVRKSAFLICTVPRLVGLRLHTLAVKAGKLCSGSPNASSDKGCTWYWMLGYTCSSLLRVKAPSCDGAMLMGPLRLSTYSSPILALPTSELAMVLSVGTFCTL